MLWLDNTQPCDVQRQRRELTRMRIKNFAFWIAFGLGVMMWEYIAAEMWKGALR